MTINEIENAAKRGHLTNKEFQNLKRNSEGDVIELSSVFFLLTDEQQNQLSEDDWSRCDDYAEELRCMAAEYD